MEQLGGEQVGLGLELNLLRGVDRGEGLLGGVDVQGAEEFPARRIGNLVERALVEVGQGPAIPDLVARVVEHRHGHETVAAGADGIDGDVARLGDLRRLLGGEQAAVVGAVGHEDDEGALALAAVRALGLLQAGEGDAEAVADGGAVLDHADLQPGHLPGQPVVVEGERGEGVGPAGEHDYADAIAGALADKSLDDGLDGLEAVDALTVTLVVLGEHRAGKVDGEHQVVALLLHLALVLDDLRPGEADDEQDDPEHGEGGGPA